MKIGVKIGLTLKIKKDGKESFQFIRPDIEISDIDPEQDVHKQLEVAKEAIDTTWGVVSDLIEVKISEELGMSVSTEIKE